VDGIRADHVWRYRFAAERLAGKRVLDAGCGVGYGASLLAAAGCAVKAVDIDAESVAYGRAHYGCDAIAWAAADLCHVTFRLLEAAACFEALEHMESPGLALVRFPDLLIASVPNEAVIPKGKAFRHHVRHYRPGEFQCLLEGAGYKVGEWWCQMDMASAPVPGTAGRTLIAVAAR
jgi:SAM-dependent methyltransferase